MALIRGCLRSETKHPLFFPNLRTLSTAILSPDSKTPLTAKSKTRAALSLLKSETNPENILHICRAASLTPHFHLDRIAFSLAVSTLSKSNNFSYIQTLIDDLRSTRPDLKTERFDAHAIVLFGQANMIDHAIRVFKEHHAEINAGSGRPGSVRCLNALLFACILCRNYREMNRVYLEFPKLYNVTPDVDTYNRVVKGFCESGDSGSAYSVLAKMDTVGVKPNASTFAEMVAGFYREEKFGEVEKVLGMMKDKYEMHLGVSIYNVSIKGLCKLKKSKEAKELLERMLKKGMKPNSVTYCELIHGFCKEGDLEEAKSLFKKMVNRGCEPDAEVYYTLVYFLCKGGDFESALRVCKESMGKGLFPNATTMKELVNGLKSIGMVKEAKEVVGLVKEKFTKNLHVWEPVEAVLADA